MTSVEGTLTLEEVDNPLLIKIIVPETLLVNNFGTYNVIATTGDFAGTFDRPELTDGGLIVDKRMVAGDFVVGIEYVGKVLLPSIFITQDGRADRVNVPQVTFLYLDLYYSGRYEVTVEKLGYDPSSMSIEQTAANVYDANETPLSEINTITVPIFSSGDIVKTTILAPDPYPSSITGYSWEGSYNNRGIAALR